MNLQKEREAIYVMCVIISIKYCYFFLSDYLQKYKCNVGQLQLIINYEKNVSESRCYWPVKGDCCTKGRDYAIETEIDR